jgi:hypothetical protein
MAEGIKRDALTDKEGECDKSEGKEKKKERKGKVEIIETKP